MRATRPPAAALRPFVKALWATQPERPAVPGRRERVLPTGDAHVVFLLGGEPLRLYARPDDPQGSVLGDAVVAGPRAAAYVKDVSRPGPSVGAQLQPWALHALVGAPVRELAGRHADLRLFWGALAGDAHERLAHERDPAARMEVLESVLLSRLPRLHGLHPAVAAALQSLGETGRVSDAVARSGYSRRRLHQLFVESVGLAPKLYGRLRRFQAVLARAASARAPGWADLAHAAGYADQSHLTREFTEFTGITPREWRRAAPEVPHHVTVGDPRI